MDAQLQGDGTENRQDAALSQVHAWSDTDIVTHYTEGSCHVLALALHRLTGLPLSIMWDAHDWHIEPGSDDLGGLRCVVHVFVTEEDGSVIDIRGRQSLSEMRTAMKGSDWEECYPCEASSAEHLRHLIDVTQSLAECGPREIAEAIEVIVRNAELTEIVRGYRPGFRGTEPSWSIGSEPSPAASP